MRRLCACVGGGRCVIRVDGGSCGLRSSHAFKPLAKADSNAPLGLLPLSLPRLDHTHTLHTYAHLTQVHQEEEAREAQIVPCWVA